MWNMGHIDRPYDEPIVQQLHMTSADYQPSTIATETAFYTTRAPSTNSHHNTQGYYPTAVPAGGATDNLSGFQSHPRAFYRANSSQVYPTHEYSSTDGNPESSSSASFIASRAGSYDSTFPQAVTPESGIGSHVDVYNYMYSHGQGPAGVVASPPALSPTSGHQHHKKNKTSSRQRKSKHPYQGFAGDGMGTSGSSNRSKLRSASRTSKNTHHNPPATAEERKSRETHNNVEKQYRNRLNAHFESLLSALPERMQSGEGEEGGDLDAGDRRVSKAEVLEMARRHIKALERECAVLEGERDELRDNMERLRWLFGRCEGGPGGPEGATFLEPPSMP
ncbi:hypothetical protein GGR51DRAFT_233413 [Nemania sp. FL0031]|nr:hypothetical protein GGR51DRAFT_233413 [Nemania sp. FL0031]